MTKITVRYFIDGAQVDEAEAELPDQAKARELIEQSKDDLSEFSLEHRARCSGAEFRHSQVASFGERIARPHAQEGLIP